MKKADAMAEADGMTRRGFIGLTSAFVAFGAPAATKAPVFKMGFMTDTHVSSDPKSCSFVKQAFELFRREGVTAIGHCGDLADYHYLDGYRNYRAAFKSVYPDLKGEPKALYVFAAHDTFVPGARPLKKLDDNQAYAEMREILKIEHEIIHEADICGVPFVVYPQSIHQHCGGSLQAFDRHLAKVCAAHPTGPIVLMTHFPPKDTVAGSHRWGNALIGAVIRKYPRVIAFTGHVHNSLRNEACIWQGDCTVVDVGCLEVWQGETAGVKASSKRAYEVIVAEFSADRVIIRRYDVRDGQEIRPEAPWTIPFPYDPATAPYAPSRRAENERAGCFPPGAGISVAEVGGAVEVRFPPTVNEEDVLWYRVSVNGRSSDIHSEFYMRPQDRAAFRVRKYSAEEIGDPDDSGLYRFEVTPVGFFGARGKSLKKVWKKGVT